MRLNELVKLLWAFLIASLFFGLWTFAIIGGYLLILILIRWLKPEWLDKL